MSALQKNPTAALATASEDDLAQEAEIFATLCRKCIGIVLNPIIHEGSGGFP
jgi:hypothetical protein